MLPNCIILSSLIWREPVYFNEVFFMFFCLLFFGFVFLFLGMSRKRPTPIQKALDSARTARKFDSATLNTAEKQYITLKATTEKLMFEDNKEVKKNKQ